MLAHAATAIPEDWWWEPKQDGRRFIASNEEGEWTLRSRPPRRINRAANCPLIVEALNQLPPRTVLDGEICVYLPGHPLPSITACGSVMGVYGVHPTLRPVFEVFDVPCFAGEDLTQEPLRARRKLLERVVPKLRSKHVRLVPVARTPARRAALLERLERLGGEGVMAKDPRSRYEPGRRSRAWLKFKFLLTLDVVFMGVTPGRGKYAGAAGAFRFGQYVDGGVLIERGKCGGMDEATRFAVSDADVGRVFEVAAYAPVAGDVLRMPRFVRWRDDKTPEDCHWEVIT